MNNVNKPIFVNKTLIFDNIKMNFSRIYLLLSSSEFRNSENSKTFETCRYSIFAYRSSHVMFFFV